MVYGRFLLTLKSTNTQLFSFYGINIVRLCEKHQIDISGPVVVPVRTRKMVYLRSVHIYKTTQECYEYRVYKELFTFKFNTSNYLKVFYFLMFLKHRLPLGINFAARRVWSC